MSTEIAYLHTLKSIENSYLNTITMMVTSSLSYVRLFLAVFWNLNGLGWCCQVTHKKKPIHWRLKHDLLTMIKLKISVWPFNQGLEISKVKLATLLIIYTSIFPINTFLPFCYFTLFISILFDVFLSVLLLLEKL